MPRYNLPLKCLHGLAPVGDIMARCSSTCTLSAFCRRRRMFLFGAIGYANKLTAGDPLRLSCSAWKSISSVDISYTVNCRRLHNNDNHNVNNANGTVDSRSSTRNKQVDNNRFPTEKTNTVPMHEKPADRAPLLTENIATIPNVLTGCRMALTPVIGYLVLQQAYSSACALFLIAGVTDLLDGYIARNYANQRSVLGSVLDPIADKLLISVLFISLTAVHLIPVPLTILVITRDISLIIAACYLRYISLPTSRTMRQFFDAKNATLQIKPLLVSKLNTAVQLGLVTATLCAPVLSFVDHPAMHALWYATAITTITSGVGYIFAKNTFKLLKQPRQKK